MNFERALCGVGVILIEVELVGHLISWVVLWSVEVGTVLTVSIA